MPLAHAPVPGTPIPALTTPWHIHTLDYPQQWQPNSTRHVNDDQAYALLHHDQDGTLDGLLTYLDRLVVVRVRPDRQRHGIGSQLMRDALDRWPISFAEQHWTPEGSRLAAAIIRANQTTTPNT